MPYYDERRKRWIGQVLLKESTPSGRAKKKTRECSNRKDALLWEAEQNLPVNKRTSTLSLAEFASSYLDYSKRRFTQKVYSEKRLAFRELFKSVRPRMRVVDLEKGDISKHLDRIYDKQGGNVANKRRKNLVAAWNWGIQDITGFPDYNAMAVKKYPEKRRPRYIPPEEDFWKVYNIVDNLQDRVMFLAYLHTAARKVELFRLTWDDVDLPRRKMQLSTCKRKGGNEEYDWIPITEELTRALRELKLLSTNELVFPSPTGVQYTTRCQWMPVLCERAGVKPFGIYALRHLTASILVAADAPLIDVQAVLRHKKISTTEVYIHRLKSARGSMRVLEDRAQLLEDRRSTAVSPEPAVNPHGLRLVQGGRF